MVCNLVPPAIQTRNKSKQSPRLRPPIQVYLRESGRAVAGVADVRVGGGFAAGGVVEGRAPGPIHAGVALARVRLLLASQACERKVHHQIIISGGTYT